MAGDPSFDRKEPTLPSFEGPIYPPPRGGPPGARPAEPAPARPAAVSRPDAPEPDEPQFAAPRSAAPKPAAPKQSAPKPAAAKPARAPAEETAAAQPAPTRRAAPAETAHPVFVSDAVSGPDALGRAASLSRLSELIAHRGAQGPLSIALLGGPGAGKTHALADVLDGASLLSTAAISAPNGPFLPRIVALKLDAVDLGEEPVAAIAERLHARITREYPAVAQLAGEEAAHASSDPRQTARALAEGLDDARRRVIAERAARDDAANRRARLTEAVLYETPGSQIDSYARAQRGRIEPALRAFGFASADPTVDYKGLVHAFAESGGTGNRLLAGLRSLFAYKGQKKLIVFAVLFFVFAWGLDRLATERAWLASLDSVESLKSTAAWFATHRSWFATGSRLFDFAALACLGLLVWRAWRFTQPLWRGAALLDQDIALRKPDLERQIAHHAQRLDALTREADVMAERAAEAERRAGGPDRASHLAPNFLREGPSRSGQARAYFDALNAIVGGETAKSAGAAPARFVVAIDSLDRLPAERGLAILTTVATALARPAYALVTAFDPRHFDRVEGGAAAVARIVQTPFNLGAAEAPAWTAFVEQLAGRSAPAPRGARAPQNGSTLDLALAEPETKLLSALAQLAGPSPRGVNRLVNLYRLARHDAPDDLAALACMIALAIGGTDAEKQAVARGLASADSFGSFVATDGGPRVAAALAAAAAAQGGPVTNASARKAAAVARMWSL
ncbi:MAG: ATP-binding protein [Beijerinckiaceae bacterium]